MGSALPALAARCFRLRAAAALIVDGGLIVSLLVQYSGVFGLRFCRSFHARCIIIYYRRNRRLSLFEFNCRDVFLRRQPDRLVSDIAGALDEVEDAERSIVTS